MNPSRIEVTIDELVLHGFLPGERYAIAEALGQELTRLFSEHGVPPSLGHAGEIALLDAGSFARTPTATGIGAQAAQAVFGGLRS